jgi:hypothetical protein
MEIQRIHLLDETSRLRSTERIACVGVENKHNGLVSRSEGKRMCGKPKRRRKINVAQKAAKRLAAVSYTIRRS